MTASAGVQPLHEPVPGAGARSTTPQTTTPQTTTTHTTTTRSTSAPTAPRTARPAGATAMAAAVAAQGAAAPRPAVLRVLRRTVGSDPLVEDALEHYVDAVGQREVGRRLAVLRRRSGPTPPWHLLHDLHLADPATDATGARPGSADHVLIGPGGVYAVTALHLPGSRVRAARTALVVDGRPEQHLHRAQQRARAVQQLLARATGADVPVRAVVAVLGAERLALPLRAGDVAVLRAPVLVRWLRRQPQVLDAATAARLATAARHLAAGTDGRGAAGAGASRALTAFEELHGSVRAADRLRRAWFVVLAVAASTGVTTLLAAVSP